MALRIREAGYPLVYVPAMIVRHPVRASRAELVRKRQRLSGGRWDRTVGRPRLVHVLGITAVDTVRRLRRAAITRELSFRRRLAVMWLTLQLAGIAVGEFRSEEHTSEIQSLMRISYAVFCLKKKKTLTLLK